MSGVKILISDREGIFAPQTFVQNYSWSGIVVEDYDIVSRGPDAEYYWDAWSNILNDAFHNDKEGNTWRLYQDGDVFAVCDQLMDDEEYKNFFGEERQ